MNSWQLTVDNREEITVTEGPLMEDKFTKLVTKAGRENGPARLSLTWGQSGPFGNPKVSVTINVACDQNELAIEEAAFQAYNKAKAIVDDIVQEYDSKESKQ